MTESVDRETHLIGTVQRNESLIHGDSTEGEEGEEPMRENEIKTVQRQ